MSRAPLPVRSALGMRWQKQRAGSLSRTQCRTCSPHRCRQNCPTELCGGAGQRARSKLLATTCGPPVHGHCAASIAQAQRMRNSVWAHSSVPHRPARAEPLQPSGLGGRVSEYHAHRPNALWSLRGMFWESSTTLLRPCDQAAHSPVDVPSARCPSADWRPNAFVELVLLPVMLYCTAVML